MCCELGSVRNSKRVAKSEVEWATPRVLSGPKLGDLAVSLDVILEAECMACSRIERAIGQVFGACAKRRGVGGHGPLAARRLLGPIGRAVVPPQPRPTIVRAPDVALRLVSIANLVLGELLDQEVHDPLEMLPLAHRRHDDYGSANEFCIKNTVYMFIMDYFE